MKEKQFSKIKKRSLTKFTNKIVLPFNTYLQKIESSFEQQRFTKNNKNSQVIQNKQNKSDFNGIQKLIDQFSNGNNKELLNQFYPQGSIDQKTITTKKYLNSSKKKYRSLTKSRSLTVNTFYQKAPIYQDESNKKQNSEYISHKKLSTSNHRSLTKISSEWIKERDKQRQKQRNQIHQFDHQKIDRNYDHLGKLRKKTTHNKPQIKSRFVSFRNLSKQINQIDKQSFQNARKDFQKKFKTCAVTNEVQDFSGSVQKQEEQQLRVQQSNVSNFKTPKKNFLKVNRLFNMYQQQIVSKSKKKSRKKNFRVSADQSILRKKPQTGSEMNIDPLKNDKFSSQEEQSPLNISEQKSNIKSKRKVTNKSEKSISSSEQFKIQSPDISQNQQTSIFDKVYFFSVKLSAGLASLLTIERINLKWKSGGNLIIEVVICVNEEIIIQKIKYDSKKKFETMKRLRPNSIDKNVEKQKLKSDLFRELMISREQERNKESLLISGELHSQKSNFDGLRLPHTQKKNFSINSIQNSCDVENSIQKTQHQQERHLEHHQHLNLMNFAKVSPEFYQLIIDYLQKFCQLEVSYLGSSLKETQFQLGTFNSLIKKKHSQMQQTLLQSLNLAKVFYFLIKINATYYVAKSVVITNRKIKYYLLYEFSNMIRHEKDCIIEQEEEINESVKTMRQKDLVEWLYFKVNKYFTSTVFQRWKQRQSKKLSNSIRKNQKQTNFYSEQTPLINALQICFGTLAKIGINFQYNRIDSEQLFKIVQSNYKNDIRWKKISYEVNSTRHQKSKNQIQNFFSFHNSFDFGIISPVMRESRSSNFNRQSLYLFTSPLSGILPSKQPQKLTQLFQYTITKNFMINIKLYSSLIRSKNQTINLHVKSFRQIKIEDHFRKEQFVLLHLQENFANNKRSQILQQFLKQQYVSKIVSEARAFNNASNKEQLHLLTMIKNKKYHIHVFMSRQICKDSKFNILQEKIKIQAENRTTVRHYILELTLEDILTEIKEFYMIYSDAISYRKISQTIKRIKTHGYEVTKSIVVNQVKFYISRLRLMKKNTYSQFYFVPLPNMISEASFKASSFDSEKELKRQNQRQSIWGSSILLNATQKQLIFKTLQKLQDSIQQKQKQSLSTITKISIKNFPIYQIYYKAVKKLIPGHFVIVSIYYMPMFDLSQVKIYVNLIRKSFWASIRRDTVKADYEKIVDGMVKFIKDKYFAKIIKKEMQKLSLKYRQFYSEMMKQAEAPFLSKTRKVKDITYESSNKNIRNNINLNRKRQRQQIRNNSAKNEQIFQLTEQLLCKIFHSPKKNKYVIRLSYPLTKCYIDDDERKGIDELINISVFKQNCMLIYKFQTTARKLLAKKVTHKFNVIQLEYQQKNKPFYILFEQIKTLIVQSDETTYGLLNTFRAYFLNKHNNYKTPKSFVSMLSLNVLSGLTENKLSQNQNLMSNVDFSKQYSKLSNDGKFIKDLNVNKYQRFCLFVEDQKILEVLKIRNKFQKKLIRQSLRHISSTKSLIKDEPKQFVKRKKERKQSIQAFLTQKNNHIQPSLKKSLKNPKNKTQQLKPVSKKVDFIIEDSFLTNQNIIKQQKIDPLNYQEKIVYFIDQETQSTHEITSSIEDQGFMINVPFGKYNKKMFKRFFKHLILVQKEKQAHEITIKQSTNKLQSSSILQVPQMNRFFRRQNYISSLQAFQ